MSTLTGDLPEDAQPAPRAADYNPSMFELLKGIDDPAQLRALDRRQLGQLADELRAYVLESVSKTGGHLSSNLGTVELTIALHYVYDTPEDRIVWDVGHQTYPHKILTGRRELMSKLRMLDGISGFPRRAESKYDTFGTAHSSTSISAALGMAVGARAKGEKRKCIAVIGDGAMSAGMAYEAMNNAGRMDADLLVVLNDNEMSISPPVGALTNYLARLLSGRIYSTARKASEHLLKRVGVWELARRAEEHVKGMVTPSTLFEEFGFNYIGPIDGHDLDALIPTLQNIRKLKGPQFLHVITRKGQGYKLAEEDPIAYHGPGKFNPAEGLKKSSGGAPTYSQIFGGWLCDMAAKDPRLVAITPAMREGSGMVEYSERFPDRYFDVGIAEQHAVTFAGGIACEGMRPVVAIYSTFLQRGYDQLIHDVAIQNLPVLFALDRGGLVGGDGATHNGAFDFAYLRTGAEPRPHGAFGRRGMPADAHHRDEHQRPVGGALSARCCSWSDFPRVEKPSRGQGRSPPHRKESRDPRLRRDAQARARGGRSARRHRGQHALREAARRRARETDRRVAPSHRDRGRAPDHGRRRQRGLRSLGRHADESGSARAARPLHRPWRPR
jgi:1-deoxy-D-xylulose-5-phosphate synthase